MIVKYYHIQHRAIYKRAMFAYKDADADKYCVHRVPGTKNQTYQIRQRHGHTIRACM